MEKKIYQIEVVDAISQEIIDNKIPNGLASFQVFKSQYDADRWMELYGYGEGIKDYKVVEYDESDIEDYVFVEMPTEKDRFDEYCSHCRTHVDLPYEFEMQICPNCGSSITPCNLCNHKVCDCGNCPLF